MFHIRWWGELDSIGVVVKIDEAPEWTRQADSTLPDETTDERSLVNLGRVAVVRIMEEDC